MFGKKKRVNSEVSKQLKESMKVISKRLIEEQTMRMSLINHETNFGMLEEFVKSINDNPGLKIKFTTMDGTTVEITSSTPNRPKTMTEILGEDYSG